jgi:inorganic phosphate transporter, PiT family
MTLIEQWIQQLSGELTLTSAAFLLLAIGLALIFEFVNGFHDTANAVATVIYTHSLKPVPAVIWSGLWNLIGVLTSTGMVAFSVVALLPAELVLNVGSGAGFAMVFALLISAICWNLGTWYLGLPASSSHTLIGSIMGVGVANSLLSAEGGFGEGVNWAKTQEVFVSLLTSPVIGFVGAALLLLLAKTLLPQPNLYTEPEGEEPPPFWTRALLILTCTGVSFAHGSNDGQKGMGLIMLILVGILPGLYALNLNLTPATIEQLTLASEAASEAIVATLESPSPQLISIEQSEQELSQFLKTTGEVTQNTLTAVSVKQKQIVKTLSQTTDLNELSQCEKIQLRSDLYLVSTSLDKLARRRQLPAPVNVSLQAYRHSLDTLTQFIPIWVKIAVAVALGMGTMIGWKRIVVTVGEKIGKDHLTYAQGASAELVAMSTIFAADQVGLPVSTTHVLASGVAGTMTANGSGIQANTVQNILLAWVLTLPACVLLGGATFTGGLLLVRWLNLA